MSTFIDDLVDEDAPTVQQVRTQYGVLVAIEFMNTFNAWVCSLAGFEQDVPAIRSRSDVFVAPMYNTSMYGNN